MVTGRANLPCLPEIDFAQIFIAFLVLLFSLTVHEAAHAFSADVLGDPTARLMGRVSLNPVVHVDPIGTVAFPLIAMMTGFPLLGWAKPVPVNVRNLHGHWRRKYMAIAAAGPASNLVLAVVASLGLHAVARYTVLPDDGTPLTRSAPHVVFLLQMVQLNVLLAIFNMLPIPPLDGGNVLSGLLPERVAHTYDRLLRPYGFLLLYALIFTGGLMAVVMPPSSLLLKWLL